MPVSKPCNMGEGKDRLSESQSQEAFYTRLSILDAKYSALLQLSSVVLALNIFPALSGRMDGLERELTVATVLIFLGCSLILLFVIWVDWRPSKRVLALRTVLYRTAVVLSAVGLVCVAATTVILLFP